MGDHMNKTLQTKPRLIDDLEHLYQGIPDESVNLTFQDLADVNASEKREPTTTIATTGPISQVSNPTKETSPSRSLAKIPSLDFSIGLRASNQHHHYDEDLRDNHYHRRQDLGHGGSGGDSQWGHFGHHLEDDRKHDRFSHPSGGAQSPHYRAGGDGHSRHDMGFDDVSVASGRGGRLRRPGIPHSKICTVCSTYIYIFRTRCLVCGRVYCRQCMEVGMGEMIEGRKCVECLGLRFSQRYIERAGKVGCCSWRYPRTLKQAELKCAEKGPRRSGGYGRSGMATSRSRSPVTPRSPHAIGSNEPSFVMSSSFSPFSPHHNLPL